MSALPVEGVVLVAAASWLGERQAPVTCACPTVENELGAVRLGALIPAFSGV